MFSFSRNFTCIPAIRSLPAFIAIFGGAFSYKVLFLPPNENLAEKEKQKFFFFPTKCFSSAASFFHFRFLSNLQNHFCFDKNVITNISSFSCLSLPLRFSTNVYSAEDGESALWSKQGMRWNWGWNSCEKTWKNWHNTQIVKPKHFYFPQNNHDVIRILKFAHQHKLKLKVVGSGCSPNAMAVCEEGMVFTEKFDDVIYVDTHNKTVRVQSGITFKKLTDELSKHKLDLSILTSISEQSIGGALANAIHNTGKHFGSLSTLVVHLQIITPSGEVLECSEVENGDIFKACLCHLGGLGFISEVSLKLESEFKLKSEQKPIALNEVLQNLDEKLNENEHFKFWWFPHTNMTIEWKANRVPINTPTKSEGDWVSKQNKIFNYILESLLFLSSYAPRFNKSINKLCRFVAFNRESEVVDFSENVFNFDCLFRQYVDEWAIPQEKCSEALQNLKKLIEKNPHWGVNFPVEVRFSKGDDIWLSPAYGRDTCWIGIIMYRPWNNEPPVFWKEYFLEFEKIMYQLGGRPHWAKENRLTHLDYMNIYPEFKKWLEVRNKLDPNDVLVNPFLSNIINQSNTSSFGDLIKEEKANYKK